MTTRALAAWVIGIVSLSTRAADVPTPPSAVERVEQRLAAIDREAARLRAKGDVAKADAFAADAARFRERLIGKGAPAPAVAKIAEVHVVGLYEGAQPVVEVGVTDRPVTLVLCAYNAVRWDVRAARGATVERIILSGYHDQSLVADAPAGAKVDVITYDGKSPGYFKAYRTDTDDYARAVDRIKELTKLDVASFQGAYRYGGKPFVLAPANAEFQAQRVLAEMESVHLAATAVERGRADVALRRMRFTAVAYAPAGADRLAASVGEFTTLGPIETTLRPIPDGLMHLAIDPKAKVTYALGGRGVIRTDLKPDPASGQVMLEPLDVPANLPKLESPCGLAFDSKRQRVVLTSLGGVGHMYAFDIATGQWSHLGDMNNVDLQALAYSAKDDCVYGLTNDNGDDRQPVLRRYDAAGKPRGEMKLSKPVWMDRWLVHRTPTQLIALDDGSIALILPPVPRPDGKSLLKPMRCMLIDPKTGEVTYEGELKPHLEGEASAR